MTLNVYEMLEDRYEYTDRSKDKVAEHHVVEADTLEECFKKAYPFERSLRYCNDRYIKFDTDELNQQYLKWKKTGVDIMMYYGNGTVD